MNKVKKAVITAAGRGTRQYPASSAVQKEMFPLVDRDGLAKPIIQIIGEEAVSGGVEEICIVTQPGEEELYRQYFRRMSEDTLKAFRGKDWAILQSERLQEFGERLHFVAQNHPEGYGHAVLQARQFVGEEPFLLLLGDHIYTTTTERPCATQVIDLYERAGLSVMSAVQMTPSSLVYLYGTLKGKPLEPEKDLEGVFTVEAIVEKPTEAYAANHLRTPGLPTGQFLCHFGMNVFSPLIFDAVQYHVDNEIRHRGEIQLTPAQEYMRSNLLPSGQYGACTIEGKRYDTGIPYGLMESQIALALAGKHRAQIVEAIARLLAEQLHAISER